jgi:hypothetical protein
MSTVSTVSAIPSFEEFNVEEYKQIIEKLNKNDKIKEYEEIVRILTDYWQEIYTLFTIFMQHYKGNTGLLKSGGKPLLHIIPRIRNRGTRKMGQPLYPKNTQTFYDFISLIAFTACFLPIIRIIISKLTKSNNMTRSRSRSSNSSRGGKKSMKMRKSNRTVKKR